MLVVQVPLQAELEIETVSADIDVHGVAPRELSLQSVSGDIVANGVVNAAREIGIQVPVVVRLEGTNADKGRELLANSGLAIIAANDLNEAARRAVEEAAQ